MTGATTAAAAVPPSAVEAISLLSVELKCFDEASSCMETPSTLDGSCVSHTVRYQPKSSRQNRLSRIAFTFTRCQYSTKVSALMA